MALLHLFLGPSIYLLYKLNSLNTIAMLLVRSLYRSSISSSFRFTLYTLFSTDTNDYFNLFNLKRSYEIDHNQLKSKYLSLQSKLHPDRFAGADEVICVNKFVILHFLFSIITSTFL